MLCSTQRPVQGPLTCGRTHVSVLQRSGRQATESVAASQQSAPDTQLYVSLVLQHVHLSQSAANASLCPLAASDTPCTGAKQVVWLQHHLGRRAARHRSSMPRPAVPQGPGRRQDHRQGPGRAVRGLPSSAGEGFRVLKYRSAKHPVRSLLLSAGEGSGLKEPRVVRDPGTTTPPGYSMRSSQLVAAQPAWQREWATCS